MYLNRINSRSQDLSRYETPRRWQIGPRASSLLTAEATADSIQTPGEAFTNSQKKQQRVLLGRNDLPYQMFQTNQELYLTADNPGLTKSQLCAMCSYTF